MARLVQTRPDSAVGALHALFEQCACTYVFVRQYRPVRRSQLCAQLRFLYNEMVKHNFEISTHCSFFAVRRLLGQPLYIAGARPTQ